MSHIRYFAYGSNISQQQMAKRCPEACLGTVEQLPGWRFIINSRGVATMVPDKDGRTLGLVWQLTAACEASLDRFEGVRAGVYRKQMLEVGEAPALVYLARDDRPGRPRPGYLEGILAAATILALPAEYHSELQDWARDKA